MCIYSEVKQFKSACVIFGFSGNVPTFLLVGLNIKRFCPLPDINLKAIKPESKNIYPNKTEAITIMETVNVLNQMAEYDFSAPIAVEMIFEDSDDDDGDISFKSALSEQENISDNNIIKVREVENKSKKDEQKPQNQINYKCLNKSMLNLDKNTRALQEKLCKEIIKYNEKEYLTNSKNAEKSNDDEHYHIQNMSDVNSDPHALGLIGNDTDNNKESLSSTNQTNNHHDPVTSTEELLNKLSEYLVLILQSFYNCVMKKNNQDENQKIEVYNFIKSHFYELSYSIVESIFLPQEQNESFKHQFLDNTVLMANNNQDFELKCQRGDVMPFFVDLLNWTKQKKENMKHNQSHSHSNDNILLKQQLVRPLLPLNIPLSEIVAKNNIATQKKQNNLCIFATGPPGSEISINIDANTLKQINEIQQCNLSEKNVNNNDCPQICESTRRNTAVVSPTSKRNRVKDIKNNNPQYDRAPPPYHINHRIITQRSQQYDQTKGNPIRNHYENRMGQPHNNHPRVGKPQHNHSSMSLPHNNRPRMGQPHPNHPSMCESHNNHTLMEQPNNNYLSMGQPHINHPRMEQHHHNHTRMEQHHNHPSMMPHLQNAPRLAQTQNNHPTVGQLQNNHSRMGQLNHQHPNMGQPHHNHPRMGQPSNNNPNMGQSTQNNPTQVYYNTNQSSPQPHNHRLNYLCNPNNNIPMYRTQIENQVPSNGVTRNMSPSNAKTRMLISRCYMCGQNTSAPYDSYNPQSKHIYCSYLCQELDSQAYQPSWGNT